ncbi:hypothetical protein [Alsobacter soli]|uniref:hypothetical protein n=1 Tax=Alsobacter soli TaxID=2109933 RepID=UPI001304C6B7|nr:hypothetical protein [Alsobacter soli]
MPTLTPFRQVFSMLRRQGSGGAPARTGSIWGEDLAEAGPLASLGTRDWASTTDDELVLYAPGLGSVSRHSSPAGLDALGQCIEGALAAAADRLSERFGQDPADIAALLRRAGVVTAGTGLRLSSDRAPGDAARVRIAEPAAAAWIAEGCALASLDRIARACATPDVRQASFETEANDDGFASAVVASAVGCVNVAHWAPRYAAMHESLTLAAWLGCLLRGRSAFLPEWLAEIALDFVADPHGGQNGDVGDGVMAGLIAHAVGFDRLREACAAAVARRRAILVAPQLSSGLPFVDLPPWDEGLASTIAARLAPHRSGLRNA